MPKKYIYITSVVFIFGIISGFFMAYKHWKVNIYGGNVVKMSSKPGSCKYVHLSESECGKMDYVSFPIGNAEFIWHYNETKSNQNSIKLSGAYDLSIIVGDKGQKTFGNSILLLNNGHNMFSHTDLALLKIEDQFNAGEFKDMVYAKMPKVPNKSEQIKLIKYIVTF